MPKLYYPTPDELQGARPLEERAWFRRFQRPILRLANTDYGRGVLFLDSLRVRPYPVVKLTKSSATYFRGIENGRRVYVTDLRAGAKWGNVFRSQWQDARSAMDRVSELYIRRQTRDAVLNWPESLLGVPRLHHVPYFATTELFPDAHVESTTVDGQVFVNDLGSVIYNTIRDDTGSGFEESRAYVLTPHLSATTTTDQYNNMGRYIFLVDSASIPDADDITSATFEYVARAIGADDMGGDSLSFVKLDSALASNTALAAGDYDAVVPSAAAATKQAADKTLASVVTDSSTYNSQTLNATGRSNISKTGVDSWGLILESDASRVEPTWASDGRASVTMFHADETLTSKDPKLVVTHGEAAAFVPRMLVIG